MPNRAQSVDRPFVFTQAVFFGRALACGARLWCGRNIRCGLAATLMLFISGAAIAQQTAADARLPNADHVNAAFTTLREWISDFQTPRMDDAASRHTIEKATGVCIVLRRFGRVMGIGVDVAGDDLMLRRAAGKALNEVLSDPALESLSAKLRQRELQNDDAALTVDALRAEIGRTLTIELEVAGHLSPLVGRSIEQFARRLEPGVDGVAIRQKGALELSFPAQLRATNTGADPIKPLLNLALKAGLSIKEIPDLAKREDLALYSFRTLTLMQRSPDAVGTPTHRGDVMVPLASINHQSIVRCAEGIALHMLASLWPEPPAAPVDPSAIGPAASLPAKTERQSFGVMGDYIIVADQYRPLVAPPIDQALCALALYRFGKAEALGVDRALAERSVAASLQLWRDLASVSAGEESPTADLAACAVIVHGIADHPVLRNEPSVNQLYKNALSRVQASFDPASGFIDRSGDGRAQAIAAHTQAMLAAALSKGLLENRTASVDAPRVRRAIDAAWQSVPQVQHLSLLPWIGWAEADYAAAMNQPLAHGDELRLLLDVLDEIRIGKHATEGGTDLSGGFAMVSEVTSVPSATAQTVRPAAWVAGAIRQTDLVPRSKAASAMQRHLHTIRFLQQLAVRDEHQGWLRNPGRALGGIRAALWDSDQPVPAQGLALLAMVETLHTLTELNADQGVLQE